MDFGNVKIYGLTAVFICWNKVSCPRNSSSEFVQDVN